MKLAAITLGSAVALGAAQANAQTTVEDADGNGTYSMAELQYSYPDLTEDHFVAIDTSGDGEVDMDELTAARDAGILAQ